MADVITTLHPENDNTIDLYPNIKKENIPNGAIDASKIQNETITETKLAPEVQQKLVEEVVSVTVSGESGLFSETTKNKLINAKVGIIINNGFVYTKSYKNPNDSYDNYYFYNIEVHNSNVTQRTIVLHGNTGLWEYSYYNKYMGFYDDNEDKITVQKSILGDANVDYIDGDSGDFNTFTIGELKAPVILYGTDELNLESKIDDIDDLAESAYKQGLKSLMALGQYDYYPATQMGVSMYDKDHRATGYLKISDCTCQKISQNRFLLGTISGVQIPSSDDVVCDLIANRVFTADTVNNVYNNINTQRMSVTSAGELVIYVNASYYANNTAEQFLASFGDVEIQYALSSSYQYNETIIPNLPILPLDSNMANKIRQKVVDGLNLWYHESSISVTSSNQTWRAVGRTLTLKPYTTYAISYNCVTTGDAVNYLSIADSSGNIAVKDNGSLITFTTRSITEITFYFHSAKATATTGTSTYSNIMLNSGNHPYPYSPFNQKEHITNDEATLLKQEEEKCRNLCFIEYENCHVSASGIIESDTNWDVGNLIKVIPNTKYTISGNTNEYFHLFYYGSNQGFLSYISSGVKGDNVQYTFTTPSNCYYLRAQVGSTNSNIMLNIGTFPEPYHEYCGEILHEKDAGVLLWENGNPNSAMASGGITTGDMSKYKYIEIVYKYSATSGYSKCVFKTAYEVSTTFFISSANAQQYGELIVSRGFTFTNSTTLTIDKGTKISMGSSSPTDDNNKIVPVAIYGSNVL